MSAFLNKYRLLLGFLIVLIVAIGVIWTHSNYIVCGVVFALGVATGALVLRNNPDIIDKYGRKA